MLKRFNYRIYPHPHQIIALARAFGCARVVWNDALSLKQRAWQERQERLSIYDLMKVCITNAKQTKERAWLAEAPSIALQQSLNDLDRSFKNWWKTLKGKGKCKAKAPRYKKRNNRQAIRFTRNGFKCNDKTVCFSKIGKIPVVWSRPLPGVPSSATIIKDRANRYFVSFVVEINEPETPKLAKAIGLDLGLNTFVTTSCGDKMVSPKPLKSALSKIKRFSRDLSRKTKRSCNWVKNRLRLALAHVKVADSRFDFLHKLSTQLIRDNQTIVIEDLCVSGMLKNRRLARAIADAGWRTFRVLLEAKAKEYGRDLIVINRFTPTSQVCSDCGHNEGKKALSIRQWTCSECGAHHDRDVNAAKNILAAGLAESLNDCRDTYSIPKPTAGGSGAICKTTSVADGNEAITRLNQVRHLCPA